MSFWESFAKVGLKVGTTLVKSGVVTKALPPQAQLAISAATFIIDAVVDDDNEESLTSENLKDGVLPLVKIMAERSDTLIDDAGLEIFEHCIK